MILGVIPARYGSTRLKGKVLAKIGDKPMVQHVYERARKATLLDELVVAVDDERVFQVVESFGGKAIMTSPLHKCGTERVEEVARKYYDSADLIVNIQGDEPFIDPGMIEEVVRPLQENEDEVMSTLAYPIKDEENFKDPFIVKVITDFSGHAIYFSRSPIPYLREKKYMKDKTFIDTNVFIYAYSKTEPEKKNIALEILESYDVIISTQVINEFIWVMNKKFSVQIEKLMDLSNKLFQKFQESAKEKF